MNSILNASQSVEEAREEKALTTTPTQETDANNQVRGSKRKPNVRELEIIDSISSSNIFSSAIKYSRIGIDDTILSPSKPQDSIFDSSQWPNIFSSSIHVKNSKSQNYTLNGSNSSNHFSLVGKSDQRINLLNDFGNDVQNETMENDPLILNPFMDKQYNSFTPPKYSKDSASYNPITTSRLIDRGGVFFQSTGKVSLRKKIRRREWRTLYGGDWFHSLVDAPTVRIVSILFFGYLAAIFFFAVIHFYVSKNFGCNMGIRNFYEAFMFSLETMATIGYGTKDIFFGDCISVALVLSFQICVKLVADALTIGIIYCRLARPHARASTVIFSNKAVIRRIRGKLYFMFQLCELRKHQLTESHVRLYLLRNEVDRSRLHERVSLLERSFYEDRLHNHDKEEDENLMEDLSRSPSVVGSHASPAATSRSIAPSNTHYVQCCTMRLSHPNDELGGMLLLMTPQVIVHEIDAYSPLMPPPMWLPNVSPAPPSTARSVASDSYRDDAVRWNPPTYDHVLHPFQPASPHEDYLANKDGWSSKDSPYGLGSTSCARDDIINEGIAEVGLERPNGKLRRAFSTSASTFASSSPLLHQHRSSSSSSSSIARARHHQKYVELYHPGILSNISFPNVSKRASNECDPVKIRAPSACQGPFLPPWPTGVSSQEPAVTADKDIIGKRMFFQSNLTRRHSISPGTEHSRSSSPPIPTPTSVIQSVGPSDTGESVIELQAPPLYPSIGLYDFACDMNGLPALRKPAPAARRSSRGKPVPSTKQPSEERRRVRLRWQDEEKAMIQRYMKDRQIEVIAVVEGVDSATGGSVQAKHSFTCDEVEWDKSFEFCVFRDPDDGYTTIDFSRFHELIDVSTDASHAGPIASYI